MIPLSVLIGKSVLWTLRRLGKTGSALPGLVVEKFYRPFLPKMLEQLPRGVVVITGTNGKTTTTKIISELLRAEGLRVLTNQTGSNFERGITSTIVDKARLGGKLQYDIAILELDEAHAVHFAKRVPPTGMVALNIMRDQMDRFGEIDTTAKMLAKIAGSTTDWLVLNANDERIGKLGEAAGAKKKFWFGYDASLMSSFTTDDSYYHGDSIKFFQAAVPAMRLIRPINAEGRLEVAVGNDRVELQTKLEGNHNAMNITSALVALEAILPDADPKRIVTAIAAIEPAFGRGEVVTLKSGAKLRLQLVKNPGGFTYVLQGLKTQAKPDAIGIAINDDYADGRDVSWLWDVQFTVLSGLVPPICGGTRGYDMAVRLKYEGIATASTRTELADFLTTIIKQADDPGKEAVIFTTYTAMLRLRELLQSQSDVQKVQV